MGRRRTSSVSTLQITGAVVVLLVIAILLALMLAPEKPIAPPNSVVTYEDRPGSEPSPVEPGMPEPEAVPIVTEAPPIATIAEETAPDAETATFTITGRVLDEDTGESVSGAQVSANRVWSNEEEADWHTREQTAMGAKERDLKAMEALRAEGNLLHYRATAKTDRRGRYAVVTPQSGHYRITAAARGYLPAAELLISVSESVPKAAMDIRLGRGASISGRVTEAGSSRGAPEVPVRATGVEKKGSRSHGDGKTDEDGYYTLTGLAPGEHEVTLDLSDVPYDAGKVLPYRRVKITDARQKLTNINFSVEAAGIVWGYVATPEGDPVASELLLCTTESLVTQVVQAAIKQKPPLNGHSRGKDGYYELVGVPLNKEWNVYATSNNYPPQLTDPFVLTSSHRTVRVDVFMFAGTNIYGYVTDTKGEPVPGAEVVCVPTIGKLLAPMEQPHAFRNGHTDEAGDFVITQVPAGNYQLFAVKNGYKYSAMGQPVFPDGYNDITNVHMVLHGADEGEHTVYGTVVAMDGSPLSGVELALQGLSTESLNSTDRQTTSDTNGQFRIDGVEVGVYQLVARLDGYATQRVTRVLIDRENTVTMSRGSVIRGFVLVQETNRPPDYYSVHATPITQQGSVSTALFSDNAGNASGTYNAPDGSFELGVSGGYYRLEARAGEYTPGRQELEVASGEVVDGITLYVTETGGVLSGRVRVADGSSPQGARVFATEAGTSAQEVVELALASENQERVQTVGEDGAFLFEKLPAGTYNLIAQHSAYVAAESGPVELETGGAATGIELLLGTGGGLEGYVYKNGVPVVGAMVVVLAKGQPSTATTDASGWYEINEIPAGLAQAMVMPTGVTDISGFMGLGSASGLQTVPVEIVSGRTTRYDFGAMTGTRIVGQCTPAPVNPLLGGAVVLRQPGSPLVPRCGVVEALQLSDGVTAAISGTGDFTIDDVPLGDWQLDVYYSSAGMGFMELTYRNSTRVQVTGEEGGEIVLEVEAPTCD